MALASFTGATSGSIDRKVLQQFGQQHTTYVDARLEAARRGDEVTTAVEAAQLIIAASAKCERESSCISLRGRGGEGPAFHTLDFAATQVGGVFDKLEEGVEARDAALVQIEQDQADIQAIIASAGLSRKNRRARLQAEISSQSKALAALDRALPLALVAGQAEDLENGVVIPGRPGVTQRINDVLAKAGNGITKALNATRTVSVQRPVIPAETGSTGALNWVGHYIPLAGAITAIDCIFPLLLWFFTFSALRPRVAPRPVDPKDDDPFEFSNLVEIAPVKTYPQIVQQPGDRRRSGPFDLTDGKDGT